MPADNILSDRADPLRSETQLGSDSNWGMVVLQVTSVFQVACPSMGTDAAERIRHGVHLRPACRCRSARLRLRIADVALRLCSDVPQLSSSSSATRDVGGRALEANVQMIAVVWLVPNEPGGCTAAMRELKDALEARLRDAVRPVVPPALLAIELRKTVTKYRESHSTSTATTAEVGEVNPTRLWQRWGVTDAVTRATVAACGHSR